MKIPFVSFEKMHDEIKDELTGKFQQVLAKNWFIQGEELAKFEEEYAAYCGVKYCVGVGNGLDALFLPLKAYGIGTGDEVIVPSNILYCNCTGSFLYRCNSGICRADFRVL